MKNAEYFDPAFLATVENDVLVLGQAQAPLPDVVSSPAQIRILGQLMKGSVQLAQVFIALIPPPALERVTIDRLARLPLSA